MLQPPRVIRVGVKEQRHLFLLCLADDAFGLFEHGSQRQVADMAFADAGNPEQLAGRRMKDLAGRTAVTYQLAAQQGADTGKQAQSHFIHQLLRHGFKGYRLKFVSYRLQVTSCRLQVEGYKLQVSDYKLQVTSCR